MQPLEAGKVHESPTGSHPKGRSPTSCGDLHLLADTEPLDDSAVAVDVFLLQVIQ